MTTTESCCWAQSEAVLENKGQTRFSRDGTGKSQASIRNVIGRDLNSPVDIWLVSLHVKARPDFLFAGRSRPCSALPLRLDDPGYGGCAPVLPCAASSGRYAVPLNTGEPRIQLRPKRQAGARQLRDRVQSLALRRLCDGSGFNPRGPGRHRHRENAAGYRSCAFAAASRRNGSSIGRHRTLFPVDAT